MENCVVVIRKEFEGKYWGHVAGLENQADIPTRMLCFKQLSDSWLSGPKFLHNNEVEIRFFDGESILKVDEILIESKGVDKMSKKIIEAVGSSNIAVLIDIKRYCALKRFIMVTGYMNRFANNLIKTIKKNNDFIKENILTPDEYNKAFILSLLVKHVHLRI